MRTGSGVPGVSTGGLPAALLVCTALVASGPAGALAGADGPAHALFRVDAARTGHLPEGPQPPLALAWTFATREDERDIEAFPAIDDGLSPAIVSAGVVYVGAHDGRVYALDARTGGKIWEFATRGHVMPAPTLHDGRLIVGSMDGFVYALDPASGAVLWKHESGSKLWNGIGYRGVRASPIVADGRVVYGGDDGRYRALDEFTGRELWCTDSGEVGAFSSPALAGGTIYVGNNGMRRSALHAIDPATGAVRWKVTVPGQIFATPAVRDGVVFFHARNDHVYAVSAGDGSLVWKAPAPAPQSWTLVFQDLTKSSPAVDAKRVYVGIDRNLVALDRRTGATLWSAPTGRKVDSSPLVVGGTVYAGSDDKSFSAFDAETGKRVWSFATGGRVSCSPTAGEGLILIGSNDGVLYAFRGAPARSQAR